MKYFTNEQLEEDKYSEAIDGYQVRGACWVCGLAAFDSAHLHVDISSQATWALFKLRP